MNKFQNLIAPVVGTTLTILGVTALPAEAIVPDDHSPSGGILDFQSAPNGTKLNAEELDSNGQEINNTSYATTNANIGDIWQSIGLKITVSNSNQPLGLFNSECKPKGGTSNNGFTTLCNSSSGNGDPDLATGDGKYGSITYNTPLQGNLLILEETPGTGKPDDDGGGGTITFQFDEDIIATFKDITFVDDASGSVQLNFKDGTSSAIQDFAVQDTDQTMPDSLAENEVENLTDLVSINQTKSLNSVDVNFDGSGGISAIAFTKYQRERTAVPFEAETTFGVLIAGGYGLFRFYKKQKAASHIKQNASE